MPTVAPRAQRQVTNAEQPVKVWSHGAVLRWRRVTFWHDSISGIPYPSPVDCFNCRRFIARTEVDSVKAGWPKVQRVIALVILVPALGWLIAQPDHPRCFYQHTC